MKTSYLCIGRSQLDHRKVIRVPPSKSYTIRALLAAALTQGTTRIINPLRSDDIYATIEAIEKMGAKVILVQEGFEIDGTNMLIYQHCSDKTPIVISCGESAALLRFLVPLVAMIQRNTMLVAQGSLCKRTVHPIVQALQDIGVKIQDTQGFPPVKSHGGLTGGKIHISGNISSQFISGLLFALPLCPKSSEIHLTTHLASLPYVRMTLAVLKTFGLHLDERSPEEQIYTIEGNQKYLAPRPFSIESDYSSAAFLIAAGALIGPKIQLEGLSQTSIQADAAILPILRSMGAEITFDDHILQITKSHLQATTIDVKDTPDLIPILSVLATQARGTTKIVHAGRGRIKESDRLTAITKELKKMGASILEGNDYLEISGKTKLHGTLIDPHHDHRIAMACTIAGCIAEGETKILHPKVVAKSYPDFFHHLETLGVTILEKS